MKRTTILFDIDGTLCDTCAVDADCFLHACSEVLGIDVRATDWTAAPHISDSGIMHWLWHQHRGRAPCPDEEQAVIEQFIGLLQMEFVKSPHRFQAVAGAVTLIQNPPVSWHLAAATGGWRDSALFKLKAAGFPGGLLAAPSTDSPDRLEIFRLGAERVTQQGRGENQLVLVGDGQWDVRVAAGMGWRFVGIGVRAQADRLRQAGAATSSTIFPINPSSKLWCEQAAFQTDQTGLLNG